MDVSVKKRALIFSEILVLSLVIGSSIAVADTGFSEEYKSLDTQKNVTNQIEGSPKLESAPINPEFVKCLNNKIYTQAAPYQNEYKTGFVPSPVDFSHLSDISGAVVSAPAYYDLRALNRVTSVKDQGLAGNCWAFATYASLESSLMPGEIRDFSENNMKNLLSSAYMEGFDVNPNDGGKQFDVNSLSGSLERTSG